MTADLLERPSSKNAIAAAPTNLPAVVDENPGSMLAAIVALAKDPSVDVTKLQALMGMQERMEARGAETQFNQAFAEMEPKMPRIKRDGTVEYKDKAAFKFARWETVDAGIRPILREHGFSLSFNTSPRQGEGGGLNITGTLLHTAGHSKSATIPLPLDSSGGKNNLQGAGSTLSYGKRYTTTMLLNIVTEGEDDDGKKGGMQYIGPGQIAQIKKLIGETNTNEIRFLETIGVSEIQDIAVGEFAIAVNLLNSKKAQAK